MIKLTKIEEPDILKENALKWTVEYLDCITNDIKPTSTIKYRYRDKSIKEQILKETHGKCVYCESKISHVCPGDIEHILPKNKDARPDLYVKWDNLTLACEVCNRDYKKDYFNEQDPLINPYEDNPEEHLIAGGPFLYNMPGDRKGYITIKILGLNRTTLIERRKERIESISSLLEKWISEQNPYIKSILKEQIIKEASSDSEYSFIIKSHLKSLGIVI